MYLSIKYCISAGPENMVSTAIQLNNPNEDGTCHNLDSNFIEVWSTVAIAIYTFKLAFTATAWEYD